MSNIHPSAEIIGDVEIGENVQIGAGALIYGPTSIGSNTVIHSYAVIGEKAQHREKPVCRGRVVIGKNCVIREFVTVHQPNRTEKTVIGDDCYIMAYSHIAHDCMLSDNITMANGTQLAGNVEVHSSVTFGLNVCVHQHCIIGEGSMIAMNETIVKHVPPFVKIIKGEIIGFNNLPDDISQETYRKSLELGSVEIDQSSLNDFNSSMKKRYENFPNQKKRNILGLKGAVT